MSAHVFIAEDEASIVSLLKYNLEKEGYKVSHSENGEDALKQIKLKQPDLILMAVSYTHLTLPTNREV